MYFLLLYAIQKLRGAYTFCEVLATILITTWRRQPAASLQLVLAHGRNKHCVFFTREEIARFMCIDEVCRPLVLLAGAGWWPIFASPPRQVCLHVMLPCIALILWHRCGAFSQSWHIPQEWQHSAHVAGNCALYCVPGAQRCHHLRKHNIHCRAYYKFITT